MTWSNPEGTLVMVSCRQARLDPDQVAERAVRGEKVLHVPVAVHDQLASSLTMAWTDLGVGHGAGLHVGLRSPF